MPSCDDYFLVSVSDRLELHARQEKNFKPIFVDFVSPKMQQRLKKISKRNELIARAVGLKAEKLTVLDVTAGFGRDAFVLAYLGCDVTLIERSPMIAALLADGLKRAAQISWAKKLSIRCFVDDAKNYLLHLQAENFPDVIYLDPMFSESKKTALVKKEMRILRDIVGDDIDADELLNLALRKASKRIVVKRHYSAPHLGNKKPDLVFKQEIIRFDVYLASVKV